ncbi:hypothetical protein P691DRAFT_667785 [Macrolepiota fuliginosa MF-IS2]|uniref:C2H2-type domain-containing protein n=1 Tax=Macrolepiota fuliginosa MF-IS2 TaxID=1400762 RepID=A0A9P5XGC3_9AGAR|nr:hypothetical protein P691DRAFT_667785 [Macrolepiota fuliginosa MF-IS2]
MHECSVCGKEFPRPSGLHTHMNTHNNAKPFPCTYPGCDRMFGVRSNAKRHLRTHGITPISSSSPPSTAPGASPAPMPALRSPAATDAKPGGGTGGSTSSTYKDPPYFKLRWLPPSLTSRTNAAALRNVSEKGVFEDEDEDEDEMDIGESNHGGRGAWGRE